MTNTAKNRLKKLPSWLAHPRTRAYTHATILLLGAGFFLIAGLKFEVLTEVPLEIDKAQHFRVGQVTTALLFYLTYLGIIARLLIVGKNKGSLTRFLLWFPSLLVVAMILAVSATLLFASVKEYFDFSGVGNPEVLDIWASFDGAISVIPSIALIMGLTPVFIPLDTIMQLPKLMLTDVKTGIKGIDTYTEEQKTHQNIKRSASILIVEDDYMCASVVMNFFRNVNYKCHHVTTIEEADEYLSIHTKTVKVIVLDNFVAVGRGGANTTGGQWLEQLKTRFPKNSRPFLVVVISGHTEFMGEARDQADLILKKPWKPSDLLDFLRTKKIIKSQA
jgi:CheY-like chemotaxis protein